MTKQDSSSTELQSSVEQLQIKVAYQEHTIESLNEEIARQQKDIEQLKFTLNHVVERVKGFEPSDIAKPSEEAPPPHY